MDDNDLPEGVINAAPAGAWESGETADAETDERDAAATGSADLIESDEPAQGADPDLAVGDDR